MKFKKKIQIKISVDLGMYVKLWMWKISTAITNHTLSISNLCKCEIYPKKRYNLWISYLFAYANEFKNMNLYYYRCLG